MAAKFKKNQIVATSNYGGKWKVIYREPSNVVFTTCHRYDLENVETGEIISGVRDKDIYPQGHQFFEELVNQ